MKGTLFSADFVTDESGSLRLLEVNTDTGFVSASFSNLDYTSFFNIISSSNITQVDVIYKEFQLDFIDHLSESIHTNLPSVTTFNRHFEESTTIYPTAVDDASNKFILRLAYDESAIFDSTYAKNNIELFKLFVDNSDSASIADFSYSSSLFEHDSIGTDVINSANNLPDVVVKTDLTSYENPLKFYKIGHSTSSLSDRVDDFKATFTGSDDETFIQKYYPGTLTDSKVKSIRSFNIVYGTDLDLISIGDYEIQAVLDKPTTIDYNDSIIDNVLDMKHYFEFTTNGIRGFADGVLEGAKVQPATGSAIFIEDVVVGTEFKSYVVGTSPDTDLLSEVREWSYPGSTLPSGSSESTSTLVNKTQTKLVYNVVSNISISGSADDSLRVSPFLYMLTYDIAEDKICYRTPLEMTPQTHQLFDNTGSLVDLDSVTMEVLEGENYIYTLDMEEADTFFLEGIGINIKLLTHNCFVEGTQVSTPNGKTPIEQIQPGDKVVSWDEDTGSIVESTVGRVSKAFVNNLVRLTFDNEIVLQVTKKHPFFVQEKGWVTADKLEWGDVCIKQDGSESLVSTVEVFEGETIVYNLHEVEPAHTFYTNDILVHNKCFTFETPIEMWNGDLKQIGEIEVGDEVKSIKNGEFVKGIVTDTLIHPTNKVVPVVKFGNMIADPQHPFYANEKWEDIESLNESEYTYEFIDNFYNLEIDGNDVNGSEHNFITEGIVVSGLGDSQVLNAMFMRQSESLLKTVV